MTPSRLSNPAFLSALEAAQGPLVPLTDQERADFAASLKAIRAQDEGIDLQDLFRRAQVARELC